MARIPGLNLPPETRRQLDENDRRWPIKLGLRALVIPFAVIAMILFAVTTSLSKQHYGVADIADGLPLAPVSLSLLYNPLVLFLTLFHRHGRPIHPGWDVAIDLLVWGPGIFAIIFSVHDGWFWLWQPVLFEVDGFVPCDDWNFWSHSCNPLIYTLGRMEIAANVFLAFISIIHFTLFVFARGAAHRRRKAKKLAVAEARNFELQNNRSPEEHMQQQPPAYNPSAEGNATTPIPAVSEENNPFNDVERSEHHTENPFGDQNAVKCA